MPTPHPRNKDKDRDTGEEIAEPIDFNLLSHILMTSGNVFEVVPGTYKEYRPRGSVEVFSVTETSYGRRMVGPTSAIVGMWFIAPSTTE